ncbi:MAG TPA: MFS transporter [Burkholderiales bacterium]|jgi:PPP family 3-phenylpropionic acid transporter|nr:MFS transporter [Burkholderiales bacterium]
MSVSISVPARLGAYYFAFFAYIGVVAPYLSLWLAARGYSAPQIAFVLAMPQLARVFAPTLWGWIADRTGWQRGIVVFTAFSTLVGLSALHLTQSAGEVAAVMLVVSIIGAGSMPLVEAAALMATRARPGSYGPVRLWGSIGFILTAVCTGVWLDYHGASTILNILIGLSALVLVAAFGIPPRESPPGEVAPASIGAVLARAEVLAFFAACMCMSVAHGALYAFLSIHLEAAGYAKTAIGALWMLGSAAEIAAFVFLPQLMRRYTLRALLLFSFACAAVRFVLIGWAVHVLALLILALLLHAATFGLFHGASLAAVHRFFAGRLEARGQAVYASLTYGIGGAAGTLIAGWAWETMGPGFAFSISALFGALGGAFIGWRVRV